tara:strand:- start:197 stop:550 length:354 start_codon:yes stop_codon:yes gene_type:complete
MNGEWRGEVDKRKVEIGINIWIGIEIDMNRNRNRDRDRDLDWNRDRDRDRNRYRDYKRNFNFPQLNTGKESIYEYGYREERAINATHHTRLDHTGQTRIPPCSKLWNEDICKITEKG